MSDPATQTLHFTLSEFEALLERFYEREDQLFLREPGQNYPAQEQVDLYAISAHAEALQSEEIDGDLWGTLQDLEETAQSEAEAWHKIRQFYLARGYYLLDMGEAEQWIFAPEVLRKLGLLPIS